MSKAKAAPLNIRDRIVELRRVKAGELLSNPLNYRKHPERQKKLVSQVLQEIGIADALLAYETPQGLMSIDGHLRKDLDPNQVWPVLILDVTPEEAGLLLLTLDRLAGLAETDSKVLEELLKATPTTGELEAFLKEQAAQSLIFDVDGGALPDLPTGDKEPFQSLTFTVSDRQAETIKKALGIAKSGDFTSSDNANSNGNALFAIAEAYLG